MSRRDTYTFVLSSEEFFPPQSYVALVALLALTNANLLKEPRKKLVNYKRAVDPYSYPVPAISFNEKPGKSKVIVETIKSISPPEFVSSDGYIGPIEGNVQGTTVPVGSVSYNAFEQDTSKKPTTVSVSPTLSTTSYKKTPTAGYGGYRYQGGSSTETLSSTVSPAPVRTSTVEPPTTLLPGFQYTSRNMGSSSTASGSESDATVKVGGGKVKNNYGRYSPKGTKKPTKTDQKHPDSRPEETGFNGYHYDVGSLGFDSATKLGGGGGGAGGSGGMMGASYMRSSSPYYNFHVMLD
ncbi:UNVERIFIED_CONTAM: hypothetical protein PYX00_010753 [Menopon gallinae]|uniref:Uncharacterized protein n=1 Tax=Menopon gallinae TaxID=328185 RepID=A0AAW2HHM1_9NEOP